MTFFTFAEQVREGILQWLETHNIAVDEIHLEEPPRERFGDLSTPLAFALTDTLGRSPLDVAKEVARAVRPGGLVAKVGYAEPGYVNFWADPAALADATIGEALSEGPEFGRASIGEGRRVQVEHTSVNPNKALHIGHARNVILGDTLARLLGFAGYDVEIANYVDDTGVQVADIVMAFRYLAFDHEKPGVKFDQYCGNEVYVRVHEQVQRSQTLRKLRDQVARLIDRHEGDVAIFAREIASRILKEQLQTCWRLGASYDALVWESDVLRERLWELAFEEMKRKGTVEYMEDGPHAGCWVARLTHLPEFAFETDKVLVKSDGSTTYVAKDMAFAMWKLGLLKSPLKFREFVDQPTDGVVWSTSREGVEKPFGSTDLAVSVIDVRQSRNQEVIRIVLSGLYGEDTAHRYLHYGYEVVSLSRSTMEKHLGVTTDRRYEHMSGRKGLYINVDPFLDLIRDVAIKESRARNPQESQEWLEEIGERVALASLRYAMLASDRNKIVVFDVDRALDVTEESGSYVLYGYVRARSILEKAGEKPSVEGVDGRLLTTVQEWRLLKAISKFPTMIERAARDMEVTGLARYMHSLTTYFNKFYETCQVLDVADPNLTGTRLALVKAYAQTTENLAKILGLPLVQRM